MTVVQVGDLMLSDESGFACSKTKLVDDGLPHLRPFNISDDGRLELGQVYQVPVAEAPQSKRELLPGDILFNNTNSVELVGKDRGRDARYRAPPAQIPAGATNALGSYLGCVTAKRSLGHG